MQFIKIFHILAVVKGKVILITGGSRGIGRAAVALFAERGAKVAFCSRTKGELFGVAKEVEAGGGEVLPFPVNIASSREVSRMVDRILSEWGKIDLLINNAGVLGAMKPLGTYPSEVWEEVLRINLNGSFFVTQTVLRTMIPRRSGMILSLTSSVGRKGRARWGAYSVSKFALEGMMQILAEEVADFGIRVTTLNPGATHTKMRAKAYPKENNNQLQRPSEVALGLLYLAESSDPSLHGKSLNMSDLPLREIR